MINCSSGGCSEQNNLCFHKKFFSFNVFENWSDVAWVRFLRGLKIFGVVSVVSKMFTCVEILAWVVWVAWVHKTLALVERLGMHQKQYSLCSNPFHYIISVSYMYFFLTLVSFYSLCSFNTQISVNLKLFTDLHPGWYFLPNKIVFP